MYAATGGASAIDTNPATMSVAGSANSTPSCCDIDDLIARDRREGCCKDCYKWPGGCFRMSVRVMSRVRVALSDA